MTLYKAMKRAEAMTDREIEAEAERLAQDLAARACDALMAGQPITEAYEDEYQVHFGVAMKFWLPYILTALRAAQAQGIREAADLVKAGALVETHVSFHDHDYTLAAALRHLADEKEKG